MAWRSKPRLLTRHPSWVRPPEHKSNAGAHGTSARLVAPNRLARTDSLHTTLITIASDSKNAG
jgi:hypothetical protein